MVDEPDKTEHGKMNSLVEWQPIGSVLIEDNPMFRWLSSMMVPLLISQFVEEVEPIVCARCKQDLTHRTGHIPWLAFSVVPQDHEQACGGIICRQCCDEMGYDPNSAALGGGIVEPMMVVVKDALEAMIDAGVKLENIQVVNPEATKSKLH